MSLKTLSDLRLSAGRLWTAETSFDFMERTWQVFDMPMDWGMSGPRVIGPTDPAPSTESTTFDVYCVFPDEWELDNNFTTGMLVEVGVWLYLDVTSGRITCGFTDGSISGTSLVSAWRLAKRTWASGSLPTGFTTLEMTLTASATPLEVGEGAVDRSYGGGPDSYVRIFIPNAVGVDTDDTVITIGDESELPTPSAVWRFAEARLKSPTGISQQDVIFRCLKGYDDVYRWIRYVSGGGPF